jgi:hypothetical protein
MYNYDLFRFLSEHSETPYYKAGSKSKDGDGWKKLPEGKFISSTALVIDSSSQILGVLNKLIEVCLSYDDIT